MNFEQSAVRAEDEWDTAEDGGEAVVAKASLCENVLALGQDDRARIEGLVVGLSVGWRGSSGMVCCVVRMKVGRRLTVGNVTL